MKRILMNLTKRQRIIVGAVIALLIIGILVFGVFKKDKPTSPEPLQKSYSQLTGVEVEPDIASRPILGVMIENSAEARPQTGLDSAGIVFESPTEGGITRFLALYQENMPETVGPIRSLRTHFLDWAMGLDVSFAHVGGSAAALKLADQRGAKSLSQFKYPEPYYRDNKRTAPHNMYAPTQKLRDLQNKLDHATSQFSEIPRKDDNPAETPEAPKITIDFSSPTFLAQFRYDKSSNTYTRYLAGKPHIDSVTGKPITVKNLVVIKLNGQKAVGGGEALVFMDGQVTKARWQMPEFEERIKITDSENNEIPLNRGDTWFAAAPRDRSITY